MKTATNDFYIDDITWNDLSMDQVFERIDKAGSSVGSEYLNRILRTCSFQENELKKRSERADYLESDPELRSSFVKIFKDLGKTKKISLYDYIFRFSEIKESGNLPHYLMIILLIASIVLIFVDPVIGIIALVAMFVVNISTYFKYKAQIEGYFMCFKYIVRMLRCASRICNSLKGENTPFEELKVILYEDQKKLSSLKRGSWLLTNSVSGSLTDVIMDYVRMLFHVDIIKFNNMRKTAVSETGTIDELFCTLGEIESDICICLYRQSLACWCRPTHISENSQTRVDFKGLYHPLVDGAVTNDLEITRPVLLTGSNASGKSTFLKQVAINQIFAQTIYTCLAEEYNTGFYKVLSSMALSDNILGKESYFIVEIKSLKRIFDEADRSGSDGQGISVMCFIDEVLRGTNTKERVAASSQILKNLSERGVMCFAATHDIELTELLKDQMDNYHFRESVEGNDIVFDYKIRKGPASSRNAIRLMEAYGFDQSITEAANALANSVS